MQNQPNERAFSSFRLNARDPKPRRRGLTEIRSSYYSVVGKHYLADLLELMGEYVDGVKFAGGAFALMPRERVRELNDITHRAGAYVSTGGWIEHVLVQEGPSGVNRYLGEAKELGFDVIELSTGFITLPLDDLIALIHDVIAAGLRPKPELGIQIWCGRRHSYCRAGIRRHARCGLAGCPSPPLPRRGGRTADDRIRRDY